MRIISKREIKRTTGDQNGVECPMCGKMIEDPYGSGMCELYHAECPHCKGKLIVERVETKVHIELRTRG